jgi:transposase
VDKKKTDCKSCDDLTARLDRLEKRLEKQEDATEHWRKRWGRVDNELRKANGRISLLENENRNLKKTIEKKDAQIGSLQKKLFAASTEVTLPLLPEEECWEAAPPKRPKGKQPGTKGFGRKIRSNLPVEEVIHDATLLQQRCSRCSRQRELLPFTEDSEEIHYSYKLVRIQHKRRKYRKTCDCKNEFSIITADGPNKLIPKGLFSTEFWTHVLLEKFWLQRPLSRVALSFGLQGLEVSEGTLSSGLKRLTKLFAPLYNAIRHQSRTASHWQMDETHWQVFTDLMGKANHKWWLWVAETSDTTLFTLDPTRSAKVPMKHLAGIENGVVTCDRYSGYQPLQEQGILLSYCWAHVRRDFIKLKDGYPRLRRFANTWIERIDLLFHYNKHRASSAEADREIGNLCYIMDKEVKRLVKRKDLHDDARSVLVSLQKHWIGLTLFLDHPILPLDNNASERALRNPVVGRKCYYGSRSIWSGCLAAMLFSLFSTLVKNRIDPYQYLLAYLKACAKNKGKPPTDITPFLPWNPQLEITPELSATMVH